MSELDDKYFRRIENYRLDEISKYMSMFSAGINKQNVCLINPLGDKYFGLGLVHWYYHNDKIEGKKYFYRASLCREWLAVHYEEYKEEIGVRNVAPEAYKELYYGILSGNKEQAKKIAELVVKYQDVKEPGWYVNILLGNSLVNILLHNDSQANKWIDELELLKSKRGMKQYIEGPGRAMRGLANHNVEELNAGLNYMLRHHVAKMKREGNTLEQIFAYDSIGLAMIAKDRGLQITVKHELLPEEYLEETEIDYSELTIF